MVVLGDSFRQWKDCIRSKAEETSGALFSQDEAYEFTKEVLSGVNKSKLKEKEKAAKKEHRQKIF